MPLRRVLLVLLLLPSAGLGAEVKLLSGKSLQGDLVRLTGKEVVLKTAAGEVATSLSQILQLDLQPAPASKNDAGYTDIELVDGTLLHCSRFALKGKTAELTLLTGQTVQVPLETIYYVLREAQDEKNRQDWKERFLGQKRTSDLVAILRDGKAQGLSGTLGEGDEEGKTIQFTLSGRNTSVRLPLERAHGLLFQRRPQEGAPPVLCKVSDTSRNLIQAAAVSLGEGGLKITTPSGVTLDYPVKLVARLDFSKGKLTFLTDLEPARVLETSGDGSVEFGHYRRNLNLAGQKIHLRVPRENNPKETRLQAFDNGLALHSHTELEYDLGADYNDFKAIIGIDETVSGADGPVVIKIEGDGRELYAATFNRQDVARTVAFSVKDVHRLRIIVTTGDLLDLSKHLTLAEARVSK